MFNFSLFRSWTFVIICISCFSNNLGWFIPSVYLPGNLIVVKLYIVSLSLSTLAHAERVGVPKNQVPFLVSINGIAGMVGRLFFGWIGDHPKVRFLFY